MTARTLTQLRCLDDVALLDAARQTSEKTPDLVASLVIDELVRRFEHHAEAPDAEAYPFPTDDAQLRPSPETAQ